MGKSISLFCRPEPCEQQVLDQLSVRLIAPGEQERFDALLVEHHYLRSATAVGEQMRYVATYEGEWLGLALWAAPALHLRAREQFIGWEDEQRRTRLGLITNNTRLLILPECRCPNLISRFMKLMLGRLSEDWQVRWGHPVVMVETFVDSQFFQGTAYKASGWSMLGATAGFARTGQGKDYYVAHGQPKQLWVKELCKGAAQKLRAPALPQPWAAVEKTVAPRCRASAPQIRSLIGHLSDLPEFRRRQSLGYPLPGMLALIAMALFCGVVRGQRDLAAFARTLSQGQLRALKFRSSNHTGRVRCPDETTFFRVLDGVDETLLERALLAWQQQILGPVRDTVIAIDGKKLRHAQGVELVSAIGVQSGRWLGTVRTASKSNEIPAARQLLTKIDLVGKTVVADALHTQIETAQQIVFDGGGDYVLTVKDNQKTLNQTIATLLEKRRFSPCTHTADANLQAGA
jgi:predicted transposase YbfD/YdcC